MVHKGLQYVPFAAATAQSVDSKVPGKCSHGGFPSQGDQAASVVSKGHEDSCQELLGVRGPPCEKRGGRLHGAVWPISKRANWVRKAGNVGIRFRLPYLDYS